MTDEVEEKRGRWVAMALLKLGLKTPAHRPLSRISRNTISRNLTCEKPLIIDLAGGARRKGEQQQDAKRPPLFSWTFFCTFVVSYCFISLCCVIVRQSSDPYSEMPRFCNSVLREATERKRGSHCPADVCFFPSIDVLSCKNYSTFDDNIKAYVGSP